MFEQEIINDNSGITANSKRLELLKKHFPNCFDKAGAFIPHKMAEIVGESGLDLSRESYSLNWLGKSYARLLANENPLTLMGEDKEHNARPENAQSENLLIKGDNLEVLKHLKNAYGEKIKMIYIDPPYNTGSDGFVYNDDRKFTPEQLTKLAGIEPDEAKRILEFTRSKANSHSAWLTFMYPRLYIARELLREDGVIFISIDDNEQAQLKMLCDEVFGEENFIASIIWHKMDSPKNSAKYLSEDHDYIVLYAKNAEVWKPNLLPRSEKMTKRYQNPDNDPRGPWLLGDLAARNYYSKGTYAIETPSGKIIDGPPAGSYWRVSKEKFDELQEDNRIWWGVSGDNRPGIKKFLSEVRDGVIPQTYWAWKDVGSTRNAKQELSKLMEASSGDDLFVTPKPIKLLERILEISIDKDKDSLIMDFFAGSGTTAHAVMKLNSEHGTNHRWMNVQIAEPVTSKSEEHKTGFQTIFDITKERIEKAAEKIRMEKPDCEGDLGFKLFETLPVFEGYLDEIETFNENVSLFDGSKLNDEELQALLTTWKLYDGMALSDNLQPVKLLDYTAWLGAKAIYFMNEGFTVNVLKAFIEKLDTDPAFKPSKMVLFGYNFESRDQRQTKEALKNYVNKKSIELDVIVRY